jgi:dipeptidyl aminopeptidase/acylaminoacyl peptidase
MKTIVAAMVGVAVASASHAASPPPPAPEDVLFGTKYIHAAALSPDGQKLAFLAPSGGTYGLAMLDLVTRKVTIPIHIEGESIQSFNWKGNDHLVFQGEIGGIEVPQVASTDVQGKKVFSLLKAQKEKLRESIYSGTVIAMRTEEPDHIIAEGFTLDSDYSKEESSSQMTLPERILMKINVLNGARTMVCPAGDGDVSNWYDDFHLDHEGQVRTAVKYHGDTADLVYRDTTTDPWRPIRKFDARSVGWVVLGFTGDDRGVYVDDLEASETGALRVFDTSTGTLGPVLFAPEGGEIGAEYPPDSGLIFSPDQKRLLGLRYTTDRVHYHWFEPKFAALQERLERSFPGYVVGITSMSDDETRMVVRRYSDRDPGAYYLLDATKGTMGLVTTVTTGIDPAKMAPMTPISYEARDGLEIHGYLTMPLSFIPGTPMPLVVHPHGGPFGPRDDWRFDPEVQFLATRGYAVLQVNFRGSGGYGLKFLNAGFHEWGGKMQDDLTDGVKWAIDKGYADPKRVAIFGASYGGYATLAGLVFTPELYKCGVNYVGVSDLAEQTRRKYELENPESLSFFRQRIGDSSQVLYSRSPVNFVERIRVPLLNAYGENDPRVDIAQWVELKAQLDKYHKTYEYMVARDEGHGFSHSEDAVSWYSRVEDFLKRNL